MGFAGKKVLFIGLVWPEPTSSAAGTRIIQLISIFKGAGAEVIFASAAKKTEYSYPLSESGVQEKEILLNSKLFDEWILNIQPQVVIYDRFMIEEQFGWRVRLHCPHALSILDTEDLHFLRHARTVANKKKTALNLNNEITKREIASILKCDLSLIISEYELEILKCQFNIPSFLLYYLPFLEKVNNHQQQAELLNFRQRSHLMFIGNMLHQPNWHTVQYLKKEIWPVLRKLLPKAELHIYGAYTNQKVFQLHNADERFYVKGRAADAQETLKHYKLLIAPIQFGAGAKGKFIDAMHAGTPVVTTTLGIESMGTVQEWGGAVQNDPLSFSQAVVNLYMVEKEWKLAQTKGLQILNRRYNSSLFADDFLAFVRIEIPNVEIRRQKNVIGEILHHQAYNSLKYMSLWIEEKNKK